MEHIPFEETRNYVQRVMKNPQVYRLRLDAGTPVVAELARRGRPAPPRMKA